MSLWAWLISALGVGPNARTINLETTHFKGTGYMNPTMTDFLAKIRPDAVTIESESGIPWLFAATQAAHESRWGESKLTVTANNLFGFTANDKWMTDRAPTVKFITRECSNLPPEKIRYWQFDGDIFEKHRTPAGGSELQVWRYFRKYASWLDSIRDWSRLLQTDHYAAAFAGAKAGDFTAFAKGLEAAGYATDKDPVTGLPVYAKLLIDLHQSMEGIA